jgi:hypothetical protein
MTAGGERRVYVGSDDNSIYAYSLGVVLGPIRPSASSLHPNYSLKVCW